MTIDHFILKQFADGHTPQVSGDPTKDGEYLNYFKLMTDVGRKYGIFRIGVPQNTPSMGAFIIRGVRATRAQLFSLPNLITAKANERGMQLTALEHREAYVRSLRTAVSPYYLPTFPMVDVLNNSVTRGQGGDVLNPDAFCSSGDPAEFIVFVNPEIVLGLNAEFSSETNPIQTQTSCPVYSARVTDNNISENGGTPLPRSLSSTVLHQLDIHFYPAYAEECSFGALAEPVFEIKTS